MAHALDAEMMRYWSDLEEEQKKSFVALLKSFIKKDNREKLDIVQYNKILDETLQAMEEGAFYTQEEADALLNKTLSNKKH